MQTNNSTSLFRHFSDQNEPDDLVDKFLIQPTPQRLNSEHNPAYQSFCYASNQEIENSNDLSLDIREP